MTPATRTFSSRRESPCHENAWRREATGLVRTMVIAASTLAILLVCFSIYQASQLDSHSAVMVRASRLPDLPTSPPGGVDLDSAKSTPGVDIGRAVVGPGEKIHMTFYPPGRGDQPWMEVAVGHLTPLQDAANAFLLTAPEVRMRTRDGHAIRVTAEEATVEAERRAGGSLSPRRGTLRGEVRIQYDRLSQEQRAALPPPRRDRIDPDDLIQIELDLLEFDVEYSKVVVPGVIRLYGRDVELDGADVEIRFNEVEDRVEYLRIGRAGRLKLREQAGGISLAGPGGNGSQERRQTVVAWLREMIASGAVAQAMGGPAVIPEDDASRDDASAASGTGHAGDAAVSHPARGMTYTETGVPVFHPDAAVPREEPDKPAPKYYARFEGGIEAVQRQGESVRGVLLADVLELVRTFTEEDRPLEATGQQDEAAPAAPVDVSPAGQIDLRWGERLIVEPCAPADARCEDAQTRVVASGTPVRLTSSELDAACTKLQYDPDDTRVWLQGTASSPVKVHYGREGVLTSAAVYSDRRGDAFVVRANGPGMLERAADEMAPADAVGAGGPVSPGSIRFRDTLEASGRFVTHTQIEFPGHVKTSKKQSLEKAVFAGDVRFSQDETRLDADAVTVHFAAPSWGAGTRQQVERVEAVGHVLFQQQNDRARCRKMELTLRTDATGREVPRTAELRGHVVVEQDRRSLRARDRMLVDFAVVDRVATPDETTARSGRSVDPARTSTGGFGSSVVADRVRAFGDVIVRDDEEALDVSSETLDCRISDGREIAEAAIVGADGRPASVRLGEIRVISDRINVRVPDQWVEAPGAGRLTVQSYKDLSGRHLSEPEPIVITWSDRMTFLGRENRSVFEGGVHAVSRGTATFDAPRLEVEFEDEPEPRASARASETAPADWWLFAPLVHWIADRPAPRGEPAERRFSREPSRIYATGGVVAVTSNPDPATGKLASRARISGPMLSVNLRPDVSKAVLQGAGDLLIEDYRPAAAAAKSAQPAGLFAVDRSGPSITLIQWADLMWYDFSVEQTQFDGRVRLTHFSGAELERIRDGLTANGAAAQNGRATFLQCDRLKADFFESSAGMRPSQDRALGGLSADRLRQLQASGSVVLQDESEGLSLTADQVIYWRDRDLLAIYGTPIRKAHLVKSRAGRLPDQVAVERAFYNLVTGEMELLAPRLRGR